MGTLRERRLARAQETPDEQLFRLHRKSHVQNIGIAVASLVATGSLAFALSQPSSNTSRPVSAPGAATSQATTTTTSVKNSAQQQASANAVTPGVTTTQTTLPYELPSQVQQFLTKAQSELSSASNQLQGISQAAVNDKKDIAEARANLSSIESEIPNTGNNLENVIKWCSGILGALLAGATTIIVLSQRKTRRAVNLQQPALSLVKGGEEKADIA